MGENNETPQVTAVDDKAFFEKALRYNVLRKVKAGEELTIKELEMLRELEAKAGETTPQPPPESGGGEVDPDDDPVLAKMRVKRRYSMTPAAMVARQQNAQRSTGPVTPEGKSACSMNAWKHGLAARKRILSLGKPCKSTCLQYPCYLVDDGATQPGQQCLDKEYMLTSVQAISKALSDGDLTDLKDIITLHIGGTLQVIDELQASILADGVYLKSEKLGADGKVIGHELKPNPSLLPLSNLLKAAGVTMPDFMITPAAVERKKSDEKTAESIASIFGLASAGLAKAKEVKK